MMDEKTSYAYCVMWEYLDAEAVTKEEAFEAFGALTDRIEELLTENAALRARNRQLEIEQELDIREIGRLALENEKLADREAEHGKQPHPPADDEPVAGLG